MEKKTKRKIKKTLKTKSTKASKLQSPKDLKPEKNLNINRISEAKTLNDINVVRPRPFILRFNQGLKHIAYSVKRIAYNRNVSIVFLVWIIIISGGYLAFPYWPKIEYYINPPEQDKLQYDIILPEEIKKQDDDNSDSTKLEISDDAKPIPSESRLVIPKIGVDSEILEGTDITILDQKEGVWREPDTNIPTEIGNMVLAGHRFQYSPPNTKTFYNLDKLEKDDIIVVFWNKQTYFYKVFNKSVVNPKQIEIKFDDPNIQNELTLYTCEPLYSDKERLVIEAKLI